jgi:hypothetical protein
MPLGVLDFSIFAGRLHAKPQRNSAGPNVRKLFKNHYAVSSNANAGRFAQQ